MAILASNFLPMRKPEPHAGARLGDPHNTGRNIRMKKIILSTLAAAGLGAAVAVGSLVGAGTANASDSRESRGDRDPRDRGGLT
jgi:hypothetical protein